VSKENVSPGEAAAKVDAKTTLRGDVMTVLKTLLTERRDDEVVALVGKLVAHTRELELRLAQMMSRDHKNEGVSRKKLLALLNDIDCTLSGDNDNQTPPNEVAEANLRLRQASGIDQEAADEEQRKTHKPKRQPQLRKPIPPHLRRVENPILVPPELRPCPLCAVERDAIKFDKTEVIDYIPGEVIVRVDLREIVGCAEHEGEITRAPLGDKVVEGGRFGTDLVATVVVDKYDDGLPLHRQKRRLGRLGLDISVSTLADQVTWATDLLRPLWRAAITEVLVAKVMHLDGTGLPVLDRDAPNGKRLGTLWGYVGDQSIAAYVYTSTGKKNGQRPLEIGPEEMLGLRRGYTVADASNLFDTSFRNEELIECGCNMHARRYCCKALDAGDSRAAIPIAAYKRLYEIEAEIRDYASPDKLAVRITQSKPVFDELVAWCKTCHPLEPPSSLLGKAMRYILNHQVALGRFLESGDVPIDNGIVERLHVRAALTRKAYLFAGSDSGGERAAIAYTILACCRLAGVDPIQYLSDVLPRMARRIRIVDLPALLPARWKLGHLPPDDGGST
jgi:transposase